MPKIAGKKSTRVANAGAVVGLVGGLAAAACVVILLFTASRYWQAAIDTCLITAIGALGLNLLTGYTGQASIGSAALLAIGAFTAVPIAGHVGFIPSIIAGALASGIVGFVVGLPAMRLRGLYLAISTLALQYIFVFVFGKIQVNSGAISGYTVPFAKIGGLKLTTSRQWGLFLVVVVALVVVVCAIFVHSKIGRAWVAIREHDVAAAVIGVNVAGYKLFAFVVSSMLFGVAGVLDAYYIGTVSYDQFTLDVAITYVAMIIVGGLASIWGSIVGAFVVTGLPYVIQSVGTAVSGEASATSFVFRNLSYLDIIAYGVVVLGFLLFEPGGLWALGKRAVHFLGRAPSTLGGDRGQAESESVVS